MEQKNNVKKEVQIMSLFTEDILTYHTGKSTGVHNKRGTTWLELHLAALFSGFWDLFMLPRF